MERYKVYFTGEWLCCQKKSNHWTLCIEIYEINACCKNWTGLINSLTLHEENTESLELKLAAPILTINLYMDKLRRIMSMHECGREKFILYLSRKTAGRSHMQRVRHKRKYNI